ncbi:alpha-mannosidase [Thermosipho melanesiensis]|uniref:Glycoside hydrolase, family 38 n=2 Tax=Thermosipho melanesiensis TaxID=46541 RepID=A6LLS1_THEM4|nr:glycoside hydrolase family 38 C-terminal domain-containing protein [Thermosipho melanesiensis]ABR30872.1 glycoside hydrolase, family 38 [Thermosipho melanesiensis BI429]APT73991.1 alpha-mannosidase [Thermosipho melanesiensis]OOC36777.1 alpha-mannosidase [Thermosipho melanesiensis]OOC38478.1 alpha-mannosidase [Thermosipho melanesiensis]OOC38940.1 alpha-mannosidase [Thermosipho melanesiensis]
MYRSKDKELNHLKRMLSEIFPYCIIKRTPLEGWKVNKKLISPPFKWNKNLIIFENEFLLSEKNVYFRGWFGGESLVYIDGETVGEINPYHREIDLSHFSDGKKHNIKVETVPRGLFGTKEEPIFNESFFIKYDIEFKRALNFVYNVIQVAEETKNNTLSKKLMDLTDEFLSSIHIPRNTEEYLENALDNPAIINEVKSVWNPPKLKQKNSRDNKEIKEKFLTAFSKYKAKIKEIDIPKYGKVFLVGHAHIDYAWLWPIDETKRKINRTFSNAISLSQKYKEFIFTQSSAKMYKDIKETNPILFSKIKQKVKGGQWETIGGMWVESDCNIPSAESLIRQFYYGQKFFEKEFGKKSNVCWLPDVFGFSWILPQILKEANIDYFVTTKLYWNESNEFPYDLCKWRGLDGSEVIYYSFKNLEEGYNGKISAKSVLNTFENFRQKDLTSNILLSFGYGDGGGGPTEEMCENYYALKEIPGIPDIQYSQVGNFVKKLPTKNLPTWDGELYLELHRGTLTSQSRIKILHKKCEDKLREVEILNVLLDKDYQKEIDNLWDTVLYNEFHDILPGSSINEVYERAEKELSFVLKKAKEIEDKITGEKTDRYITIFNPSSFKQKIKFTLDKAFTLELNGKSLKVQKTFDGKFIYYLDETIDPLEFLKLKIKNSKPIFEEGKFKNNPIDFSINEDGTINLYYEDKYEKNLNTLMLYKDIPYYWENWDIDINYKKSGIKLEAENIQTLEEGPLRKVIQITYNIENSTIRQYYIIWKDSKVVEIKNEIDWHMRRSLLKALFPTDILSRIATYDLDIGYIQRPTHKNTNYEKARFEVLGHRWVNLSQYDFGISILNNGKYGHHVDRNTIELSLLKSGIYPDFFADEGKHEFSYAILPSNDVKETIQAADIFNKNIIAFYKDLECKRKIEISPDNFKILALKQTNNNIVLRIAEVVGTSGKLKLNIPFSRKISLTNILEEEKIELKSNEITYFPFKIYTLLIEK